MPAPNAPDGIATATQSRHSLWLVCALLLAALVVRLPGVGRPLVGYFATKNVVYAMVARNLVEGHGTLAYPTLDCLAGNQRAWHLLEWPVSAYLTAGLWCVCGGNLDVWGRLTAVAFSVASVGILYAWMQRRCGPRAAVAAGWALALAPVSVLFGQSFMLEASLGFFMMVAVDALDRWLAGGRVVWLGLTMLGLALALLTKAYMAVLLLPLACTLACAARTPHAPRRAWIAAVGLILATVPAWIWYVHAYTAGDPAGPDAARVYYSVRASAAVHGLPHPLLRSPGFYVHMLDDLTGVVLTPVGFCLALAGLAHPKRGFLAPWLLASGILVLLLPRKFFEMPYYFMAILPPLCGLIGLGWDSLARRMAPTRFAQAAVLTVALLFSVRHAAGPAWTTPEEDRAVVAAGAAVRQLSQPEEPVATMHGTTLDLLYYCHRPGWALSAKEDIDRVPWAEYRAAGVRWFVVAGPKSDRFAGRFELVFRGDGFCVYRVKPLQGAPSE